MALTLHQSPVVFIALLLTLTSNMTQAESLPDRLPALNAQYAGNLNYIDYSSAKPVSIPLEIQFLTGKDGKTLIVDRVFTDPGFQVFSLSVMRYSKKTKTWTDENFEGESPTSSEYKILEFSVSDENEWTVRRTINQQDNNRDAVLTITDSFHGTEFTSETRVDYMDTKENENLRRNWIELKIVP